MRLATIRMESGTRAVRVEGTTLVLLREPDVRAVLELGNDWREQAASQTGPRLKWEGTSFAPPIPRPEKIVNVGWNYASHNADGHHPVPQYPAFGPKFARSLIGAYDPIAMPPESEQIDSEVELGIVVGSPVRRASLDEAAAAIAGYTVCNDVSVRDWQKREGNHFQGKVWERMTPVGPVLVTPDEIGDAKDLRVESFIDERRMQDSRTRDMIFSPAKLVSYLSTFFTLDPGDLIISGTPGGSGQTRNPPVFLKNGNTVRTRIAGIGELVNRCVPEVAWKPAEATALAVTG